MMDDLNFLKSWCLKFSDLLIENSSTDIADIFKRLKENLNHLDQFNDPLKKRIMNSGATELYNFYKQLDLEIQLLLNSSMKERFGISIEELHNNKLKSIIKKKKYLMMKSII